MKTGCCPQSYSDCHILAKVVGEITLGCPNLRWVGGGGVMKSGPMVHFLKLFINTFPNQYEWIPANTAIV